MVLTLKSGNIDIEINKKILEDTIIDDYDLKEHIEIYNIVKMRKTNTEHIDFETILKENNLTIDFVQNNINNYSPNSMCNYWSLYK